jgi:DNA-binding HxlR family transcriptional regulator
LICYPAFGPKNTAGCKALRWLLPDKETKLPATLKAFTISYLEITGHQKATTMPEKLSPYCQSRRQAVRDALDVIGGKWKLVILTELLERKRRFKELSRDIGISPNILAKELHELGLNKLVTRTVCNTRPITVEYAVTEHSRTLVNVVEALTEWGYRHHEAIVGKKRFADPTAAIPTLGVVKQIG